MKIKEIVDFKIKEGDYFSHDDPEYSNWHKFARLQDLYDFVDDGGNYDKEEVEAEVKWLRKELDMHPSERRGVSADTYKKGWSPHGHNARLENINEECGEGEYYCRKSGMCKPIPDGYKVTDDGTLINERLIGPTRMAVQKYFDNEAYGLRRARIDATEKALKISNMDVDSKGIVQDFKYEFGEGDGIHHDCAKSFKHKKYGECTVIPGEHTLLEDGTVTHYDATFTGEDGDRYIVRNVAIANITDVISEGHVHASKSYKKKKMIKTEELSEVGPGFLASGTYIFAINGIIKAKGRLDQVKKAKDIEVKNTSKAKQKEIHDAPGGTHSYTIGLLSNKKPSATQNRATRGETMLVDSPDDVKIGDKFDTTKDYRTKDSLPEVATAGSTSAGNIAAVNNPHVTNPYLKKGKKKHPKPVSVSALDDKTSSVFGGPLRRL
jgi:hypothetical protein|tara:strand:- start:596 stop:1903 length:1308 start_codon:yes stop_codon:yes gene_type:complete